VTKGSGIAYYPLELKIPSSADKHVIHAGPLPLIMKANMFECLSHAGGPAQVVFLVHLSAAGSVAIFEFNSNNYT
jgi:hypothetical protein